MDLIETKRNLNT